MKKENEKKMLYIIAKLAEKTVKYLSLGTIMAIGVGVLATLRHDHIERNEYKLKKGGKI